MMRAAVTAACCGAVALTGCEAGQVLCAPLPPWAVAVDVRDSVTNAPLAAGARGAAHLGTAVDSLRPDRIYLFPDTVLLGGQTEGIVEVRVERAGYAPWFQSGVHTRLGEGECPSWITQALTARLQPE